ncbi:MAG: thiamine phosphate synthase [Propionibacteriaceae bacterium]|nr:thiamine phosphate synthase [Propionibacteriaceae bacterium]
MTVLWDLTTRLKLSRLGLVTDTRGGGSTWEDYCRELFLAGVDLILIDQPGLEPAALAAAVQTGLRAGFGSGRIVGLVSPSWPEVATDLVQWASHQPLPALPADAPLVGRPAQTEAAIERAMTEPGLSYFTVGPVQDAGETDLSRGLELVATAARRAPVANPASRPWFATGGISQTNLEAVLAAGARRLLVRRAITQAADSVAQVRAWSAELRRLWQDDPALKSYRLALRSGRV